MMLYNDVIQCIISLNWEANPLWDKYFIFIFFRFNLIACNTAIFILSMRADSRAFTLLAILLISFMNAYALASTINTGIFGFIMLTLFGEYHFI